ncbi:MAG: hypothetical protein IID32_05185, partial [Planctomycetes bacterium]|nr:hypothetical protein [Planctomycetota bacterium]
YIDFTGKGIIKIDGDVTLYIVGDITAGSAFELQVVSESENPNASLTLYLGGNFVTASACRLNNKTEDPLKLQIYALPTCETINLANNAKIYGLIYAPDTDVTFQNSVEIYGSLITNNSNFVKSVNIHYDARLRDFETESVSTCSQLDFVRDVDSFVEL